MRLLPTWPTSSARSMPCANGSARTQSVGPHTAAGGVSEPTVVAASGVRTTKKGREVLRIALIGCGHIGTVHSYALAQLTRAGLVDAAVTSTFDPDRERAERIAGHHDARATTDLEAALDGADVAWICTWTAGHDEAVAAAAAR